MKYTKISMPLVCILLCFSTIGCSALFTTSWGKWAVRDLSATYAKQDTKSLVSLIDDASIANDASSAKVLIEALGDKSDLTSLSKEEKDKILHLVASTTISIDAVTKAVDAASSGGGADSKTVIKSVLDSIETVDTDAATKLLQDQNTLNTADPVALSLASISLVSQVAKKTNINNNPDAISEQFKGVYAGTKTPDEAVSALIPSASQADKDSLLAAMNTAKVLGTTRKNDISNIEIIGGKTLADFLK